MKCKNCSGNGFTEQAPLDIFGGGGIGEFKKVTCRYCKGTGDNTEGYGIRTCKTCQQEFTRDSPYSREPKCPSCRA